MSTYLTLDGDVMVRAGNIFTLSAGLVGCWVVWGVTKKALEVYRSPLRKLPGPPSDSILFGNFLRLVDEKAQETFREWQETYGHVFAVNTVLGSRRCVTTDHKAIAHILANNMIYYKPEFGRFQLSYLLGEGLVTVEGPGHRHQRRALNPAFNTNQLRDNFSTFLEKSAELRDLLRAQIKSPAMSTEIDALHWLSRATIDIIGLAGFNYDFNTIRVGEAGNELAAAIHQLNSPKRLPVLLMLKGFLPFLRVFEFDEQSKLTIKVRNLLRDIGRKLIAEKDKGSIDETGKEVDEAHGRDILSQIIKLNTSKSVASQEKLSIDQILDQIPTFLVAGHETTAVALAWCLFSLSQDKAVQGRLREELSHAFPDDAVPVTMESLNSLPYLDAVVRETLRFNSPIDNAGRVAVQDDIIPLDKPFVQTDGTEVNHIRIKKGDGFFIPILEMNRSKDVWGEDGDQFNPDRWLRELSPAAASVPALWSNIMTFLGGPRSCIGYRFAILEMKALLLYLIRAFEFELAADPKDVIHKALIVTRPSLRSRPEKGSHLPMTIRPVSL
ncbi:cytochrome P450 [Serendipita vermifera]|nr:cytochrome P450 [Serendipita vermifera]